MFRFNRRKGARLSSNPRRDRESRAERRGFARPSFALERLEPRHLLAASVVIGDASLLEGNAGTANMSFAVTRSGDLAPELTVGYITVDGTAKSGADYVA